MTLQTRKILLRFVYSQAKLAVRESQRLLDSAQLHSSQKSARY